VNQRISLILNGVLAVAVIGLYVLHFKGQKGTNEVSATDTTKTQEAQINLDSLPTIISDNGAIAFIDFEQLTSKYKFYKDGVAALENDFKRKEAELMKKQQVLEENFARYQQLAQSLTPEVREKREKDLMEEEQRLLQLRDRLGKELTDKEANFNKEFLTKIDTYLKTLSKEKNYSYVFTYVKGGPATIVYAKDSLNISTQVINSLNEQYKKK